MATSSDVEPSSHPQTAGSDSGHSGDSSYTGMPLLMFAGCTGAIPQLNLNSKSVDRIDVRERPSGAVLFIEISCLYRSESVPCLPVLTLPREHSNGSKAKESFK